MLDRMLDLSEPARASWLEELRSDHRGVASITQTSL